MTRTGQLAARTAAALVVIGGLVAAVAAPGGSQTIEVGEVRGDAYGLLLDITSDLGDGDLQEVPIGELVEAANAGDDQAVASLLAGTGIDYESVATSPNTEDVAITLGPIPQVTLPPEGGGPFTDSLADLNLLGLLGFELAEVSTEGALGPDGFAVSEATIANYFLDEIAGAALIDASCEADLGGVAGAVQLVDGGSIIGPFPSTPGPNTNYIDLEVSIGPLEVVFFVTLNEQDSDEDDIEVNGIHTFLSLVLNTEGGPVNLVTIDKIMAHASCGVTAVEVPAPTPVPIQPRFTG